MDADGNGHVTVDEFLRGLKRLDLLLTPEQIKTLLAAVDADASGTIELDEFLAWYTGRNWQMALHAFGAGEPAPSDSEAGLA